MHDEYTIIRKKDPNYNSVDSSIQLVANGFLKLNAKASGITTPRQAKSFTMTIFTSLE